MFDISFVGNFKLKLPLGQLIVRAPLISINSVVSGQELSIYQEQVSDVYKVLVPSGSVNVEILMRSGKKISLIPLIGVNSRVPENIGI